jgi:hypothetical protein
MAYLIHTAQTNDNLIISVVTPASADERVLIHRWR